MRKRDEITWVADAAFPVGIGEDVTVLIGNPDQNK